MAGAALVGFGLSRTVGVLRVRRGRLSARAQALLSVLTEVAILARLAVPIVG